MKKPIIGVMPLYDEDKESIWMLPGYFDGIKAAGGIPLMLPRSLSEEDFDTIDLFIDGYLFTGGHDIHPSLYGEEKHPQCGIIEKERDALEAMIFRNICGKKPVLGICRGIQLINALMGGTLYQDLRLELDSTVDHHMSPPYDNVAHNVTIINGSILSDIANKEILGVNSYHHQGIKELAPGLIASAIAEDGLIEAVEGSCGGFLLAVQWHPEFSYQTDEVSMGIFKKFTDICR